jgi:hypothetical protein
MMWCLAIGQESIPECHFSILPDDNNLNRHKTNTHRDYILPTLEQAAALPANANNTVDVLPQLGATMAPSSKAAEAQNATQRKQLDYMKEKNKKKKDKAEKWHGPSHCLVLNVASTDGQCPADEIPESYQTIINTESVAMADKELHSQMVAKVHHNVSFAHSTAASIYNGSILWHGHNKPSNLSFFTLYKNNHLSDAQTLGSLSLHILNNNVDNKKHQQNQSIPKTRSHHPQRLPRAHHRHGNVP